jgi:hypothetical protein
MERRALLLGRIRILTGLFIIGLFLSGATALPLPTEVDWLVRATGADNLVRIPGSTEPPAWAVWLVKVQAALRETSAAHPFLFYGTDWLAFGHFAIAIAFVGALRDPVRNVWLFTFGMIACGLVIPYAFFLGALRGIPVWWRLIDCSFGVFGFIPLWCCRRWMRSWRTKVGKPVRKRAAPFVNTHLQFLPLWHRAPFSVENDPSKAAGDCGTPGRFARWWGLELAASTHSPVRLLTSAATPFNLQRGLAKRQARPHAAETASRGAVPSAPTGTAGPSRGSRNRI